MIISRKNTAVCWVELVTVVALLTLQSPRLAASTADYEYPLEAGKVAYIYKYNVYDGDDIPLTEGRRPAWSPDGKRIAFYRPSSEPRRGDLFLINANGTGLRWLRSGIEPSWSPDGTKLVYTADEGIAVLDLLENSSTTILRHDFLTEHPLPQGGDYGPFDQGVGKPEWSPDGTRIAFEHLGAQDYKPSQVWLMYADGREAWNLPKQTYGTSTIVPASDPAWSPDGLFLVLFAYPYGLITWELAANNGNGGLARTIVPMFQPPFVSNGAKPSWWKSGAMIAFTANVHSTGSEIWFADLEHDALYGPIPQAYEPTEFPMSPHIAFTRNVEKNQNDGEFPPVRGPALTRVYTHPGTHSNPAGARSRLLIYVDNSFELQYLLSNGELLSYWGIQVQHGLGVRLDFNDDSRWQASGTFTENGKYLQVNFNAAMSQSDFEDGVYESASAIDGLKGPVKEPDEPKERP